MIRNRFALALALMALSAFSFLALGCESDTGGVRTPGPSSTGNGTPTEAGLIARQYGLHIQEQATTIPVRLPNNLEASSQWSIKQHACVRGGYDLQPYAGQKVGLRLYRLAERDHDEAMYLAVVRKGGDVVGAFLTVENSCPGILALTDARIE